MRLDPVMLRRLRAEGEGMLPPDLLAWATAALAAGLDARARRAERDRLLVAAAALLDGPPWTRARALAREMNVARRAPLARADTSTVGGCVVAALQLDRRPLSESQLYRILTRHR